MSAVEEAPALRNAILQVLKERRSVRAFTDQPVERSVVEAILDAARWAPSGANMQPWNVCVLTGESKQRVTDALLAARAAGVPERPDYRYYPTEWFEPFKSRRTALGVSMYKAQGGRRSPESRQESWNRNYAFFGAPVALLFFLNRGLATGSWLDYGMFIQNVMLAARAHGLETCPQASVSDYPDTIRAALGIEPERLLICALSLGHPDWTHQTNLFERTRVDVANFATFYP